MNPTQPTTQTQQLHSERAFDENQDKQSSVLDVKQSSVVELVYSSTFGN